MAFPSVIATDDVVPAVRPETSTEDPLVKFTVGLGDTAPPCLKVSAPGAAKKLLVPREPTLNVLLLLSRMMSPPMPFDATAVRLPVVMAPPLAINVIAPAFVVVPPDVVMS